jgi:putative PIN family toxin of toxin-antitoxin system
VFDTNILVSAVGWKGKPFECVELARSGTATGITCREILEELAEKLETKLALPPEDIGAAIADLLSFLLVVAITGTLKVVSGDSDDDKVLECAELGGASHIVTGDRRHLLPLGKFKGIDIVTAADFLTIATQP